MRQSVVNHLLRLLLSLPLRIYKDREEGRGLVQHLFLSIPQSTSVRRAIEASNHRRRPEYKGVFLMWSGEGPCRQFPNNSRFHSSPPVLSPSFPGSLAISSLNDPNPSRHKGRLRRNIEVHKFRVVGFHWTAFLSSLCYTNR